MYNNPFCKTIDDFQKTYYNYNVEPMQSKINVKKANSNKYCKESFEL